MGKKKNGMPVFRPWESKHNAITGGGGRYFERGIRGKERRKNGFPLLKKKKTGEGGEKETREGRRKQGSGGHITR